MESCLQDQTPTIYTANSVIWEFGSGVQHFSGHYHVELVFEYNDAEPNFNDYVAPYSHTWDGTYLHECLF